MYIVTLHYSLINTPLSMHPSGTMCWMVEGEKEREREREKGGDNVSYNLYLVIPCFCEVFISTKLSQFSLIIREIQSWFRPAGTISS